MSDEIIFKNVYFSYDSGTVLENLNFSISRGDFVSVLGPNGGGKTTLAGLILGLLTPDRGEISIWGKKPEQLGHTIGYVPQYTLFDPRFPVTVKDVVLMGRLRNGTVRYSKRDTRAARTSLADVGMEETEKKPFSALSGGQRQRVLIARALATEPQILILDEPTANVDAAVEERLSALLGRLNRDLTVILITHDLGFVSEMVNKVVCVNRQVHIHPTSSITEEHIRKLYHDNMKIVRHDIKEKVQ